jgi:hypothetical protein
MKRIRGSIEKYEPLALQIRKEWEDLFFDNIKAGRGIDQPEFEKGIEWLYDRILNRRKPEIIYCDSWENCLKVIASKEITEKSIRDNIKNNFLHRIHVPFNNCFFQHTEHNIQKYIIDSVLGYLDRHVNKNIIYEIEEETNHLKTYFRVHSWYGCLVNIGNIAMWDFLHKTGVLNNPDFKRYRELVKSCAFVVYMYYDQVFAVQPPIYLALNTQGRIHSIEGPAVKFRDGSAYYFVTVNGRSLPSWVVKNKDRITREKFLNEKNAETRAAIYEVLGHKKIMEMLGAETVHTSEITHANGDVETVELLKTRDRFPEIENQPFAWVKVTCPSTGTNYLLGVEPKHTNAAEAVASLSMFESGEYSFNFRT